MLNKEQKKAIEIIENPLIVIAGPGTGKTHLITEKIDYLLSKKNLKQNEILALTFTDKAANEMSMRVEENSSIPFKAKTFHAFALELIDEYLNQIPQVDKSYQLLDETNQLLFFAENFDDFNISSVEIRNKKIQITYELQSTISKLKDFGVSLQNLDKVEFNNLQTKVDIFSVFSKYEKYKRQNNFLDFGDILQTVLELLKSNEKIMEEISSRFKYILVDEFQDTNLVQLEILKLLAKNNITIVGDKKQSIYSFRGANEKNLIEFKKHFTNFEEIFLHENYRSSKKVIQNINKVVFEVGTKDELLTPNTELDGEVSLTSCINENSQNTFILEKITEISDLHKNPSVGILCRTNSQVTQIKNFLSDFEVKFNETQLDSYFEVEVVKNLILILESISKPKEANSQIFHILINSGLRQETVKSISRKATLNEKSIFKVLEKFESEYEGETQIIKDIHKKISSLFNLKNSNVYLKDLILKTIDEFNIYKSVLIENKSLEIQSLNYFLEFISKFIQIHKTSSLEKFLSICNLSKELNFNLPITETLSNYSIEVLTIHGSKGKEFDFVIIPNLNERKFPMQFRENLFNLPQSLIKSNHLEDEKRLFFVALSRAKNSLYLSNVKKFSENKLNSKPSDFLESLGLETNEFTKEFPSLNISAKDEIKLEILKKINTLILENKFDLAQKEINLLSQLFSANNLNQFLKSSHPDFNHYKTRLNSNNKTKLNFNVDMQSQIYSVSQLQTYDSCPQKYLYTYIYKIPTTARHYFDFGTSIHKALELLVDDFKSDVSSEKLYSKGIAYLTKYWISKGYENASLEKEYLHKGMKIIKEFIEKQKSLAEDNRQTIAQEKRFIIEINGKKLQGIIDRIDKVDDEYEILDYKTSNSMEPLRYLQKNMQLLVYSMALKDKTVLGEFPRKAGLWYLVYDKISSIKPSEDDIADVKEKITNLVNKIESGNFKPVPSLFACKFCDFNNICPNAKK